MKGWKMYSRIHQLKESGFKKAKVAKKLGINVKTVSKYWTVLPEEYHLLVNSRQMPKFLEQYEDVILRWLNERPDMSSAQVHDWLKECYQDTYKGKDHTVRSYANKLREKYNIPKNTPAIQNGRDQLQVIPASYKRHYFFCNTTRPVFQFYLLSQGIG